MFPIVGLATPDLFTDRREGTLLAQPGTPAVTIDAAAYRDGSVPVRTGKAGVNRQLIYLAAEAVPPETIQVVIPFAVIPECRFAQKYSLPFYIEVG